MNAIESASDPSSGLASLRDAATRAPGDLAVRLALAEAELAAGDAVAAERHFAEAQRLAPNDPRALDGLARAAATCGRADGEIWARRRLAELRPDDPFVHAELGDALRRDDRNDEASAALFLARARAPRDRQIRMLAWQTLPIVHPDLASCARSRAGWARELGAFEAELAERPPSRDEAFALLTSATNFHRHYLGEPLFDEQRRYGAMVRRLARIAFPELEAPPRAQRGPRRRIGFVSAHFREHTVLKLFGRWITGLDATRFERMVFALDPRTDSWTERLRASVEHFVPAPDDVAALPGQIRAAQLDVVVHLDIGMHPWSQLLAALKFAPLQLATWGHPITSGLDTIDRFVSGAAMEPPGAASHYTEQLVVLPNLGIDYEPPESPSDYVAPLPDRSVTRYLFCPQSAHKLHPGHDAAFAQILARCPGHALVLVPHPKAHVRDALARRLAKAFRAHGADPARQLVVLPALPYRDFLSVARGATLLLDSFDWSGGNTSLEALAFGTPLVTLPGDTMRSRHSAAILRLLGLDELVARDAGAYVATAAAIAAEPDRRGALAAAIAGRSDTLYGDPSIVPAFEELVS
ncbi:MAG TPA: tetratricopeptide repeat protein [Candidatus Saccharimonadia bacterium]|nr:tetratricopeptide repeat protein [Candidatus Saccharimonadia bacterium]